MKRLLPLLLFAILLTGSATPSSAATCNARMSPLRCLFASLQDLRSPPHARSPRWAAVRPRPVRLAAPPAARRQHVRRAKIARSSKNRPAQVTPVANVVAAQQDAPASRGELPTKPALAAPLAAVVRPDAGRPDIGLEATVAAGVGGGEPSGDKPGAAHVAEAHRLPNEDELEAAPSASKAVAATALAAVPAPSARSARALAIGGQQPDPVVAIRRLFGVADSPPADPAGSPIGATVSPDIELEPLPTRFLELRPYFSDLRYCIEGGRVLLVLPATRRVMMSY